MLDTAILEDVRRSQLKELRKQFSAAAKKYDGLHWGLISLAVPYPLPGGAELEVLKRVASFEKSCRNTIAEAVAGPRVLLEVVPQPSVEKPKEVLAAIGHDLGFVSCATTDFFFDNQSAGSGGLAHYKELAATAARCCRLSSDRHSNTAELCEWGNRLIQPAVGNMNDPIIRFTKSHLEVSDDRKQFWLGDTPAVDVPAGEAVDINGERLPWGDVLWDLSHCDLYDVLVLDAGVFRASEEAIGRMLAGEDGPTLAETTSTENDPKTSVEPAAKDWPPDGGLHLLEFKVAYGGAVCELTTMQYRLLEASVAKPEGVTFSELGDNVWFGAEPADRTIHSTLSQAKTKMRTAGLELVAAAWSTQGAHVFFNKESLQH